MTPCLEFGYDAISFEVGLPPHVDGIFDQEERPQTISLANTTIVEPRDYNFVSDVLKNLSTRCYYRSGHIMEKIVLDVAEKQRAKFLCQLR